MSVPSRTDIKGRVPIYEGSRRWSGSRTPGTNTTTAPATPIRPPRRSVVLAPKDSARGPATAMARGRQAERQHPVDRGNPSQDITRHELLHQRLPKQVPEGDQRAQTDGERGDDPKGRGERQSSDAGGTQRPRNPQSEHAGH